MNDLDKAISRDLRRLARYAPEFEGIDIVPPQRTRTGTLVAISAAVIAIIVLGGVWAGTALQHSENEVPVGADGSSADDASQSTDQPKIALRGAEAWPTSKVASCGQWQPSGRDEVVVVERLGDGCLTKAPLDQTTVLVGSYDSTILGETWEQVTQPWRTVEGHELRRLTSGTLPTLNSRYVDAVACSECDQVLLVLGPNPGTVEQLIRSVA